MRIVFKIIIGLVLLWLLLELGVRLYVESPLETGFYRSIPRQLIPRRQEQYGVKVSTGPGWIHLGWIADPENESYLVEKQVGGTWQEIGQAEFGSYLVHDSVQGEFRVIARSKDQEPARVLGQVSASPTKDPSPIHVPRIAGPWRMLFKPETYGYYINDHTVYQDAGGNWRLVGITDKSDGNFNNEVFFAVGFSQDFPPENGMEEAEPVADYGELAWAPHVIHDGRQYHMFWSPHRLHQMTSMDGTTWGGHQVTISAPFHKFFRDPMVLEVSDGQWLLYTTARGKYYSQIDLYQSFDLQEWQFIRSALSSGWGSERNAPFSSMESPFVIQYQGHYYLSSTYNNDSFFWPGILLMFHLWPDPASYNDTLVFHSNNPYDFGVYRGKTRSSTLLTTLEAHAPEFIYNPETQAWHITTAGWPWVATLTSGEVAVAPLTWSSEP